MKITVVCYGALRDHIGGQRSAVLEVGAGATVEDVRAAIGAPEGLVFQVLVDGEQSDRSRALAEGQEVTLMPPFTGG